MFTSDLIPRPKRRLYPGRSRSRCASMIETMRADGHEPCVVVQTSTGRLQAWVRVSPAPLEAALATAIGKNLAHSYGADLASTDWSLGPAGRVHQSQTHAPPA